MDADGTSQIRLTDTCTIFGWAGNDRLRGTPGRDVIVTLTGDDRIDARDGVRDLVDCGSGLDVAFADQADGVLSSCERVRRS